MTAPTLVWAWAGERRLWHLFVEMTPTALGCGETFHPRDIGPRHLSVRGIRITACGECLAFLHELIDAMSESMSPQST